MNFSQPTLVSAVLVFLLRAEKQTDDQLYDEHLDTFATGSNQPAPELTLNEYADLHSFDGCLPTNQPLS